MHIQILRKVRAFFFANQRTSIASLTSVFVRRRGRRDGPKKHPLRPQRLLPARLQHVLLQQRQNGLPVHRKHLLAGQFDRDQY